MTKKIMFSDKYGLTQAVLDGRKTQTRRILTLTLHKKVDRGNGLIEVFPTMVYFEEGKWKFVYDDYIFLLPKMNYPKYKIGEVVAVAQSYNAVFEEQQDDTFEMLDLALSAGWNNKMFVHANLMPHKVRITNVRIERLQDISDEDSLKEGIREVVNENGVDVQYYVAHNACFENPREAFAHLVDEVSGKGTWDNNPYVFVYDFELIK